MVRIALLLLLLASCADQGGADSLTVHMDGRVRAYGGVVSGR